METNKLISWKLVEPILKWAIVIVSVCFLTYKLITFNQYNQLFNQWKQMPLSQLWWLVIVVAIMPFNWILEAIKWEMLTHNIEKISLKNAIKAVLAGISTGFFTPNRVGELVGRVLYMQTENRKAGITLSLVNSLTQNLIMAIIGVPASLIYFYYNTNMLKFDYANFLFSLLAFIIIACIVYFYLPRIGVFFSQTNIADKISGFTSCLSAYTTYDLSKIMLISLLRYAVFCTQFFLILRFFNVHLQLNDALISIPTYYLFITFSPTFAFSEAALRSSYAVLFISSYSSEIINIALAGIFIWAVNFIIPMLAGTFVLIRSKS
jgi:Large-conductance mechanosensitive channel